jgi:hypothetical protein
MAAFSRDPALSEAFLLVFSHLKYSRALVFLEDLFPVETAPSLEWCSCGYPSKSVLSAEKDVRIATGCAVGTTAKESPQA